MGFPFTLVRARAAAGPWPVLAPSSGPSESQREADVPYYFTCPKCNERNYGFEKAPITKPDNDYTYFSDLTCMRCGVSGIFWVNLQSEAADLREGHKGKKLLIAIGATPSDKKWFDPEGRNRVRHDIVKALEGVATLDASFGQGQRLDAMIPERKDAEEGVCAGLSLHWIRRVLQGGDTTFRVAVEKKGVPREEAVIFARLKRQIETGADIQKAPKKKEEWTDEQLIAEGFKKTATGWSVPKDKGPLWDKLEKERAAEGNYPARLWSKYAAQLDTEALNVAGRNSKRPFSNLAVICSHPREVRELPNFARDLCARVLKPGTAALVSVGVRGVGERGGLITGHAIGVYCRSETDCFLFDPNVGSFKCKGRGKLEEAIVKLILDGWRKTLLWTLDSQYGYSLFERRAAPEDVRRGEVAVSITPSPRATALQNPQAIPPVATVQSRPAAAPLVAAVGKTPVVRPAAAPANVAPPPQTPAQVYRPQGPPQHAAAPKVSSAFAAAKARFEQGQGKDHM
jgi:hypothetical protein